MKVLRVGLIEDEAATRSRWRMWLDTDPKFRCQEEFASAEEALLRWNRNTADMALVDLRLPGLDGIECVRQLKQRFSELGCLVVTAVNDSDAIYRALRAGANGYLLKSAGSAELLQALRDLASGGAPMSPAVARKVLQFFHGMAGPPGQRQGLEMLTDRELEVLGRVSAGGTNKEIAAALGVTMDTIKAHCRHIYEKLHVSNRAEAAARYVQTSRPHSGG